MLILTHWLVVFFKCPLLSLCLGHPNGYCLPSRVDVAPRLISKSCLFRSTTSCLTCRGTYLLGLSVLAILTDGNIHHCGTQWRDYLLTPFYSSKWFYSGHSGSYPLYFCQGEVFHPRNSDSWIKTISFKEKPRWI